MVIIILVIIVVVFWCWKVGGRCFSKVCLDGKMVIIMGVNMGIGKEIVVDLVNRGIFVICIVYRVF